MIRQICEFSPSGSCVWVGQQHNNKDTVFCQHCNKDIEVGYIHFLEEKIDEAVELLEVHQELQMSMDEQLQKKNEKIEIQEKLISTQTEMIETMERMTGIRYWKGRF